MVPLCVQFRPIDRGQGERSSGNSSIGFKANMIRRDEIIGFVGLGNMGGAMCDRLVKAGYSVLVYDLRIEAVHALVEAGARACASVSECSANVDLLFTSLPRPDHVEEVMGGDGGGLQVMQPGSVWVDMTTNQVELIRALAKEAPPDVHVVDSPVTGAVDGARNGTLTLFVGGEETSVERVTPILKNLGLVIPTGPLGSGNVVKLVTNQLWFVHAAALGEGFALGMANGVELETLWRAIKESVGDSFVARHDAPSIFAGHYDPSFPLDLCVKDLNLIDELSKSVATKLPMTEKAAEVFVQAADRYGHDAGELHVVKRIEEDAQLSFQMEGDWTPPWER